MIRPLRQRHRWLIPLLMSVLVAALALALTHPRPSPPSQTLPDVAGVAPVNEGAAALGAR
jgi:hypothetical protein